MRVSQLRGQVKVKARGAIAEVFGFKNPTDETTTNANRAHVADLKKMNAYTFGPVRYSFYNCF